MGYPSVGVALQIAPLGSNTTVLLLDGNSISTMAPGEFASHGLTGLLNFSATDNNMNSIEAGTFQGKNREIRSSKKSHIFDTRIKYVYRNLPKNIGKQPCPLSAILLSCFKGIIPAIMQQWRKKVYSGYGMSNDNESYC